MIVEINVKKKSFYLFIQRKKNSHYYLDDPMRIYACQGNDPKPASSPPTIRRWAVCFAIDIPQPTGWEKEL